MGAGRVRLSVVEAQLVDTGSTVMWLKSSYAAYTVGYVLMTRQWGLLNGFGWIMGSYSVTDW